MNINSDEAGAGLRPTTVSPSQSPGRERDSAAAGLSDMGFAPGILPRLRLRLRATSRSSRMILVILRLPAAAIAPTWK